MATIAGIRARHRRLGALAAAVALCAAGCAGCGSSSSAGLVVYSGQHEQTVDAIVALFEHRTGIQVTVRSGDEDTLADEIVNEGSNSPADVIWTENSPALEFLQSEGLLAKVDPATLARTQRRYDSPEGDWVGVSARVSVLVYDPRLIAASALPTHVLALAGPAFRGKLVIAPGETDFQPIVTALERADGRSHTLQWLRGLAANAGGNVVADNESIVAAVNDGQAALGIINQYYWYRLRAEIGDAAVSARIAYFAPRDPGYVIDVSGAAVLASSHHQRDAQRFLAFLVSPAAQDVIADPHRSESYEYPIDAGVRSEAGERPFASLVPYPITVGELGDGAGAVALLRDAGLL